VNTSDEGLIDEVALADALKQGQVHAVALDVYNMEPFYRSISTYDSGVNFIVIFKWGLMVSAELEPITRFRGRAPAASKGRAHG